MKCVTASLVKLIACLTMLIDHIGLFFYPNVILLRWIGRLSFPLFVFLLVEGFEHTRSRRKYFWRLAGFALISEIPFDLAFYNDPAQLIKGKVHFEFSEQNVIVLLALGFLMMSLFAMTEDCIHNQAIVWLINGGWLSVFMYLGYRLQPNYEAYGIAAIALCYLIKRFGLPLWMEPVAIGFSLMCNPAWPTEALAVADAPIIYCYNGQKGVKINKYLFYFFYPVHLLAIVLIRVGMEVY